VNQDFIFDFLPSFYKERMVDANGANVLAPLFEEYAKFISDLLMQAQQISLGRSLELCPTYIKEMFKTLDIRDSARDPKALSQQFSIDPRTICFDGFFYDVNFTKPVLSPYTITRNAITNTASLQFSEPFDKGYPTLYVRNVYWNPHLLRDLYGRLAKDINVVYDYTSLAAFVDATEKYRRRLLGIFFGLRNISTIPNIEIALGMYLGLKHAPVSGTVHSVTSKKMEIREPDGNIVAVESASRMDVIRYPVGTAVSKYSIVEEMPYLVYDFYSNPARFTQYLLCEKGATLLWLLRINKSQNEKYAFLNYDAGLNYDDGLFWDMGDNTDFDATPVNVVDYPRPAIELCHRFDGYSDARFNSAKIYEMFGNMFIVEIGDSAINRAAVADFMDRIKPAHTGCIVGAAASIAVLDSSPGRTPTIFEH